MATFGPAVFRTTPSAFTTTSTSSATPNPTPSSSTTTLTSLTLPATNMIRHEFTTVRITVSYGHAPRAGFFLNVTDERINKDCDDEPKFKGLCDSLFSDGDGVYLDVHTGTDTAWKKVSLAVMREIWRRYGVNPVAMRLLDWEDAEPRE